MTYIYNKTENVIKEVSGPYSVRRQYNCYERCKVIWSNKQKVYEGIDFNLDEDYTKGTGAPIIAYPIIKSETVDDIWNDFFDMWSKEYHDSPYTPRGEAILKLQEHFDIIRK